MFDQLSGVLTVEFDLLKVHFRVLRIAHGTVQFRPIPVHFHGQLHLGNGVGLPSVIFVEGKGQTKVERIRTRPRQHLQRLALGIAEETVSGHPLEVVGEAGLHGPDCGLQAVPRFPNHPNLTETHTPQCGWLLGEDEDFVESLLHLRLQRIGPGRPDEIRIGLQFQRVDLAGWAIVQRLGLQIVQGALQPLRSQQGEFSPCVQGQRRDEVHAERFEANGGIGIFRLKVHSKLEELAGVGRSDHGLSTTPSWPVVPAPRTPPHKSQLAFPVWGLSGGPTQLLAVLVDLAVPVVVDKIDLIFVFLAVPIIILLALVAFALRQTQPVVPDPPTQL